MDKKEELTVGKFFIERFNNHHNLNYQVIPNNEESKRDGDIDVYAITDNREVLNLQIKTGEPEFEHFLGSRRKHGSGWFSFGGKIDEIMSQIIKVAEQKYSDKNRLIFLISEKRSPLVFDKEFAKWLSDKCGNSSFKGVYLVKLPLGSGEHPYEGQVVAIKDVFENQGEVF